ncbi:hypothetical protein B0A69_13900 [Chryseobacterium shigense]|uniref:Uncharacterized protein n=1 Tax=Chryseobacterium shigense TaxID=297244 RepID=A0A1N7HV31_9FLAO|nr:hypothetical protein [Chryseobacterium shigense]PQA93232.1 hypothetical protein B0A69_13900 [Chryseobacterium shigense]SIS28672.1 hypothetical protein SAMN05421639_101238 [Chryseobacterium shigense]
MELRKDIEPDFDTAEKRYPEVLQLILAYTDYCDEQGDEDQSAYQKLEDKLHEMTGKEMSRFNLWEWWEADGAENLAFDIALPDPVVAENMTKDELSEIVRRLKTFELPDGKSFETQFYSNVCFGNGYYYQFLKLNFKKFNPKLFQRNKDKNGNYFEYSQHETTEILWNDGCYHADCK